MSPNVPPVLPTSKMLLAAAIVGGSLCVAALFLLGEGWLRPEPIVAADRTDRDRTDRVQGASRVLGIDGTGLGPVGVPCALPPWLAGEPLSVIARQLEVGDGSEGRDLLLRLLRDRRGLILPAEKLEGQVSIDPPWRVLSTWYASLSPEAKGGLVLSTERAAREFGSGPIDAASPLLWLPGVEGLARRRLEEAIERGDRATAMLLCRRPELSERLHPTLRQWIEAETGREVAPLEAPLPRGTLRLEAQIPIGLTANPLDNLDVLPHPNFRRVPITDLVPAIGNGVAIVPGDRGPFALDLEPPHQRLWNLPIAYPDNQPTPGPLRDTPWIAKWAKGRLVAPLRTPRKEYSPTIEWVHEDPDLNDWHDRGWVEPGDFRWDGGRSPVGKPATARLALEGFTIGGAPSIIGNRVHWIATRGFDEVETWVFALDLQTGAEIWRAHVSTVALPWHAMNDLAGLLPEGRIVPFRDDLFVIARGGAISRVGRRHGDLRGILLYPRAQIAPRTGKWGLYHFAHVPAFRPRYLSDAWIDVDARGRARLIALPPDSTQILGIDLDDWLISWAHPAPSLALLKRDFDDTPWVLDLSIEIGTHEIAVWSLEAATGRLRETKDVKLVVPGGKRPRFKRTIQITPTSKDVSPLISGVPTLIGGSLAVPLREGWAFWTRSPLVGGPPDEILPWPEGSVGGTIHPIGNDRFLAIHRADPEWRSRSLIEIYSIERAAEAATGGDAPGGDAPGGDAPGGEGAEDGNDLRDRSKD